jgi:hypothetical protein
LAANGFAGCLGYRLLLIEIAHIRLGFSLNIRLVPGAIGGGEFVLEHSPRYFNVD